MPDPTSKTIVKNITLIIILILGLSPILSAQETAKTKSGNYGYLENKDIPGLKKGTAVIPKEGLSYALTHKKENLSDLQKQARLYRQQGLELQRVDDLDSAMAFYQKATELDPVYAVPYNDLGIIYEAKGWLDRAEDSYLKAIKIDPDYLSAYSNLALLYENKHQLDQAEFFWQKRAELGLADDPWTQRAKSRLEDIWLVLDKRPNVSFREQEILEFMQDVSANLSALKKDDTKPFKKVQQDNRDIARDYFNKAKLSYEKADFVTALKQALEAQQLDPSNKNVNTFIEELQRRLLSR